MAKPTVCILDYGSGNVKSVYNIFTFLDYDVQISNTVSSIVNSSHLVLPGVGAFGVSMEKIMKLIPFDILENEVLQKGKPFLGICIGMQVLADKGMEFGEFKGFGWVPGTVDRLESEGNPLPHIGWNEVTSEKDNILFSDLGEVNDFYFIHSNVFEIKDKNYIAAQTEYGCTFTSAIQKDNIFGVQFHPEKSQKAGQVLIKNFMKIL